VGRGLQRALGFRWVQRALGLVWWGRATLRLVSTDETRSRPRASEGGGGGAEPHFVSAFRTGEERSRPPESRSPRPHTPCSLLTQSFPLPPSADRRARFPQTAGDAALAYLREPPRLAGPARESGSKSSLSASGNTPIPPDAKECSPK